MNLASHRTLRNPIRHTTASRHQMSAQLSRPLSLGSPARPLRPRTFPVLALAPSLASVGDEEHGTANRPPVSTWPRLAGDGQEAAAMPVPPNVTDNSASARILRGWLVQSLLLEALARDRAGDAAAAQALESALELAEQDRVLLPFLVHPVPELLECHSRNGTDHADLVAQIFKLDRPSSPPHADPGLREPLTESEARVLRYLPTNLTKREIADELYVSVHTVKTHVKHLYTKLDVHSRRDAVHRARELGLLAGSAQRR